MQPAHYHATKQVSGVIRIWGHGSRQADYMGGLVQAWERAFEQLQPGVSFRNELYGDDSALGGVYTGAADLALLDREPLAIEDAGFEQVLGYKPFGIKVAHGSMRTPHQAPALAVFVNSSNPLTKLTLTQLDGIFGADRKRGSPPILHWSDLGVSGDQGLRLLHLYGFGLNSVQAHFFEESVFEGSKKWNCQLRDFYSEGDRPAAAAITMALARDKDGIAISAFEATNPSIRALALSSDSKEAFVMPDEKGLRSGKYPLTRAVFLYLNRKPGSEIDATLKEFLDFVVSADGQALVDQTRTYLPLSEADRQEELK
jgi:phosphate transport system substrate-binding protein